MTNTTMTLAEARNIMRNVEARAPAESDRLLGKIVADAIDAHLTPRPVSDEIEQLRVQLSGCGVIAMSNTRKSLAQQMPRKGAYGWSQSLDDVRRAVEREMCLREKLADLEADRAGRGVVPLITRDDVLKAIGGYLERYYPASKISYDHMADKVSEKLLAQCQGGARDGAEIPDPMGCNKCVHPDCGRFNGPRQVECRAMRDNACAREYTAATQHGTEGKSE